MRISDWSSDVCSSDLQRMKQPRSRIVAVGCLQALEAGIACAHRMFAVSPNIRQPPFLVNGQDDAALRYAGRSEERRVGKAWVSTCRSRWEASLYRKIER